MSAKVRIYDLAREHTPGDLDEKAKKKVQAEITRRIIHLAPNYGQHPKTASSSLDGECVAKILDQVKVQEVIAEATGSAPAKSVAKSEESEAKPAPKPKLKIVRRITHQPAVEEPKEDEPVAELEEITEVEDDGLQASSVSETDDIVAAAIAEAEEKEAEEDVTDLQDLAGSIGRGGRGAEANTVAQKPAVKTANLSHVKSIPLRPASAPSHGGRQADGQPYRVARPTSAQAVGRSKKKRPAGEDRPKKIKKKREEKKQDEIKIFSVTKPMTVRELSQKTDIPETTIITYFFMKKIIKTVNDMLEKDLIIEFLESQDYLVDTEEAKVENTELVETLKQDESEGNLEPRPPVVAIMGHVDHGKTTLLDTIREAKSNVVDGESGGITQHIGAYRIETKDYDDNLRKLTFLDTPGHEAFTAMRKRGANVTDIVILIVAADDGIMPQTIESIKHIKEAKVPFLVAVNKIDKEGANPDKVLGQLTEHDIVVEQYGGDINCSQISALGGKNIDDLLEKILLVADAELADTIMSNPNREAVGTVVEAELSRAQGPLATILVQNGTLKVGDHIAAGAVHGRVKAMFDENNERVKEAPPSTPVKILGLSSVPKAGDSIAAYKNIKEAKAAAEELAQKELEEKRFRGLSAFASGIREGQQKELNVIIKADVQGSAEAIAHELNKLSTEEVLVKPIAVESGSITAHDVDLAERTGALVLGFHVGTDLSTAKQAEKAGVTIKSYEIIYKLTEDIERVALGLHASHERSLCEQSYPR